MNTYNQIFSIISIILGLMVVIMSIGQLIIRLILAFLGLMLINYGLYLRGSSSLQWQAYSLFSRRRFW
ncbi:MAG TPA: hypothetical protein VGW78_04185 [Candidatus Babeliales bacterium]|jgi:hypothetical protein|nr:hypothetical protein [Candidatus Babeliales bacterium]